jgi:hypothetical protein
MQVTNAVALSRALMIYVDSDRPLVGRQGQVAIRIARLDGSELLTTAKVARLLVAPDRDERMVLMVADLCLNDVPIGSKVSVVTEE